MKIAVGLSGGVDSSVAALLLKQAGYDVIALFMQNWHDTEGTLHGDCEWEEDKTIAEMVAKKIGIPFYFVDLSEVYRKRVVDYMFNEYEHGRTPNPDVLCNREIKFDAFMQEAFKLGADYVATGHYCRKEEFINSEGKTIYRLLAGKDDNKDQSYFLCQLTQEQLAKAMFPIGDICKPEVRRIAKEAGLQSADKKDSQGICFVGKVNLPVFLQQKLKPKEGKVIEIFAADYHRIATNENNIANYIEESLLSDLNINNSAINNSADFTKTYLEKLSSPVVYSPGDGKEIGIHQGAQFYTIGQRRGLDIGGHKESIFIISIDIQNNIIYVGEGQSHPGLYRKAIKLNKSEIHWIRKDLSMKNGESRRYRVRIRYRQPLQDAVLYMYDEALYILFNEPQRGITPGQFAAWYDFNDELIGSGVI